MTQPACPPEWTCTFHPPKHVFDPWWTGPWGIGVAVAGVVALCVVLCVVIFSARKLVESHRDRVDDRRRREREDQKLVDVRAHVRAIEEQRTMQVDAARGNPEVLKLVREMQES